MEYVNLIRTIYEINLKYNRNIRIFCIFPLGFKNQKEAEEYIADKILKTVHNEITFAIIGSIHASKNIINIFQSEIIPAGYLIFEKLKNNMCSILFKAKNGEFFNNGLRKLTYNKNDLFDKNFDYAHELDFVSPCSFL